MNYRHPLLRRLYAETKTGERGHLADRRVMVTGAGGSIGSVLCGHLLAAGVRDLTALDSYDGNLWALGRRHAGDLRVRLALGDVRNANRIGPLMAGQDFVFHCAAAKHVPMLEDPVNHHEGESVNVDGTGVVLNAALAAGIVVVNCSTDKAAEPLCRMGHQKRAAERLLMDFRTAGGRGVSVRLVNVLDSTGSVLPLWRDQIASGGPIQITHRDMARYFITADTAADLLIRAALMADHLSPPPLLIPRLNGPLMMLSIAGALCYEAGTSLEKIGMRETGIRPGEKIREVLAGDFERPGWLDVRPVQQFHDTAQEVTA